MARRGHHQTVAELIGSKVSARRRSLNLSANQLATSLGVTAAELQASETGRTRFTAEQLVHLAGILEVPPSWFFEEST